MKINRSVVRPIEFASIALLACSSATSALEPAQVVAADNNQPLIFETVKTNWSRTLLTNVIEVRLPKVVVLDQFHTNTIVSFATNTIEVSRTQRVDQFKTNLTYSFRTNWATRTLTNIVVVDQYHTNRIDRYTTNLLTQTRTNTIVVDTVRTNLLYAHHTNLMTLNITNWEMVVVMKTNWVKQPVTNIVAIDLSAGSQSSVASAPSKPAETGSKVESPAASRVEDTKDLMFEWARTSDSQKEVVLTLKSSNESGTTLKVQEWRVERSDAAILLMGRQPEFRGELPPGTYNVTVKARSGETGPIVTLRGAIKVTPDTDAHQVLVATVAQR